MATMTTERRILDNARGRVPFKQREPGLQAETVLQWAYAALPLVVGADKFLRLLTDWRRYVAPPLAQTLGGGVDSFLYAVGVVELAAGVLVLLRPRWGGAVVGFWLLASAGNLVLTGGFLDVALRDAALAVGAFALSRLSAQLNR